jgi:hypothetical protein
MKIITICNIAFFTTMVISSDAAFADFTFSFPPPLTISSNYISTSGISDSLAEERRARPLSRDADLSQIPSRNTVAPFNLTFTPNMQRRKAQLNTLAIQIGKANPGRTEEFKVLFLGNGSGDVIQQLQSSVTNHGLKTNNLAHAYAALWIDCWKTSRGDIEAQPDTKQIQSVVSLAERALGTSPAIANLSVADKQSLTDAMWVQLIVLASAAEGVKANPSTLPQFQNGVREVAKTFNIDIDNFTLTPNGFVEARGKKRSDASDSAPGAEPTTVASASPAKTDTSEGGGLFPGIVIAGLAGSGIAAAFLYGKNKGANKRNG